MKSNPSKFEYTLRKYKDISTKSKPTICVTLDQSYISKVSMKSNPIKSPTSCKTCCACLLKRRNTLYFKTTNTNVTRELVALYFKPTTSKEVDNIKIIPLKERILIYE